MFHCNGWTFTWGIAARGCVNVCIRSPTAANIYSSITKHNITHMGCAPVIFNILLQSNPRPLPHSVNVLTGGASPPEPTLQEIEQLGFHVTHAYGLTEATAPALVCEWRRSEWDKLPADQRARLKARQGVSMLSLADADVMQITDTMSSRPPRDGKSFGEIVLRGNTVMKGCYKNPEATAEAFGNGEWFLTGDIGVMHQDGCIEIKDRKKDVIISGGENIGSVEVERVVRRCPGVDEVAVVAMPHRRWGEVACAFVTVKEGCCLSEEMILRYCKERLAKFIVPKRVVVLEELPKTVKGSVQKFELRAMARKLAGPQGARVLDGVVSRL